MIKKKRFRREFEEKVRQDERNSDSYPAAGYSDFSSADTNNANNHRAKQPRVANKMTPFKAVTLLADSFMEIDLKMEKKVEYATEKKVHQKWRCIVKCGAIEGIAESILKIVAREIACEKFLNALKQVYPDGKIPEYELPNGILLNPEVYEALEAVRVLGKGSGAKIYFDVGNDERAIGFGDNPAAMYKCTYHLNEQQFTGRSASKELAQLEAAGKLFQTLRKVFEEYEFRESQRWID